jgi:hypothetical protein
MHSLLLAIALTACPPEEEVKAADDAVAAAWEAQKANAPGAFDMVTAARARARQYNSIRDSCRNEWARIARERARQAQQQEQHAQRQQQDAQNLERYIQQLWLNPEAVQLITSINLCLELAAERKEQDAIKEEKARGPNADAVMLRDLQADLGASRGYQRDYRARLAELKKTALPCGVDPVRSLVSCFEVGDDRCNTPETAALLTAAQRSNPRNSGQPPPTP